MLRTLVSMLIFFGFPSTAQTFVPRTVEEPCVADGGPHNCVKNLACIGEHGRWFEGRAIGWNSGILLGRTSDGVSCNGNWRIDSSGIGRAELACEDGTTAEVISEYQDYETGTTVGVGKTGNGEEIRSFSGRNVVGFLKKEGVPILPCGDAGVELDESGVPIS